MFINYSFMIDRTMYPLGPDKPEYQQKIELKRWKHRASIEFGEKILNTVHWQRKESNQSPADDRIIYDATIVVFPKQEYDWFKTQILALTKIMNSAISMEARNLFHKLENGTV